MHTACFSYHYLSLIATIFRILWYYFSHRLRCIFLFLSLVPGSVIKHQLVTHLSLGIALRYVLDALRKPADSKVCVVFRSEFL